MAQWTPAQEASTQGTSTQVTSAQVTSAQQPVPSSSEITLTRWAVSIPGLYFREYDLPGGKADFLWGTSVAGSPDFESARLGWYNPLHTLPLVSSGLLGTHPTWNPWSIGLGSSNGLLIDSPRPHNALDTPSVQMHWQRGAFGGNNFRLDFSRNLVDSVTFHLGLTSQSTDSSGAYRYLEITHQPFVGTLKRDSSSIPFQGRNLKIDAFNFAPQVVWTKPWGYAGAQLHWIRQHSDDASRHAPRLDSSTYEYSFLVVPYRAHISDDGMGLFANIAPHSSWSLDLWHQITQIKHRYARAPLRVIGMELDSLLKDTLTSPETWNDEGTIQAGNVTLDLKNWNTSLKSQYESRRFEKWLGPNLQVKEGVLWQDRQAWTAQISDTLQSSLASAMGIADLGMHRYGDHSDESHWSPAIALQGGLWLNNRLDIHGAFRQNPSWPSLEQTRMANTARLTFPNTELQPEQHRSSEFKLAYKAPAFSYGLRLRYESVENAIRLGWVLYPQSLTLQDSVAFRYENVKELGSWAWAAWAGINLYRWKFWIERESQIESWLTTANGQRSTLVPDVSTRLYKGSVYWSRKAVQGRLGISVRWDFQWIGEHHDFALRNPTLIDPTLPQEAYRVEMPKYFVLHFESRMQIKSFELYARIDNLNHAKTAPEAGYTPPGVSFRYGIQWGLKN